MLKKLTIENYVLIDSLTVEFKSGLSVITGETGAGKSILVGALGLLSGAKADAKTIRDGASKCVVEGVFDIQNLNLKNLFEDNDIDYDDETIIRREITASGKSRAFINDTPVSLTLLKEVAKCLIEIHSQHQNLLLADNTFQLDAIDIYASNTQLLQEYKQLYFSIIEKEKQLNKKITEQQKNREEEEYLKFVVSQLSSAALQSGEDESLESERNQLTHAEEIKESLYKSDSVLSGEEGVISQINSTLYEIRSVDKKINIGELLSRLESLYIELKDIASEITSLADNITYNPQRLAEVEERLSLIYTLQKRYSKASVDELLQYLLDVETRVKNIGDGDDCIEKLQLDIAQLRQQLYVMATKISAVREKSAIAFAQALETMARPLSLPNIKFKVEWERDEQLGENGAERAVYTFSANKNTPLTPLSKSASGGEISRLMLCVKAMIANNRSMPVLFFDEIDSGISGETAAKVGAIMADMAKERQIVVITHLPQVAAKGNWHYNVYKEDGEDKTVAGIRELTDKERVDEVARMMSSGVLTEAAQKLALELLNTKR